MCRINTANYDNCKTENGISISGDRGKKAGFKGRSIPIFIPNKEILENWKNNSGKISEEENNKLFVTEYYNQVLSKLDPKATLNLIPKGSILLCYGDNMNFCYRHLVAFWFELFLGVSSSEVYENPVRETLTRLERPIYLKTILEEVIKENYDMKEFNTIMDAYDSNCKNKRLKQIMRLTYK